MFVRCCVFFSITIAWTSIFEQIDHCHLHWQHSDVCYFNPFFSLLMWFIFLKTNNWRNRYVADLKKMHQTNRSTNRRRDLNRAWWYELFWFSDSCSLFSRSIDQKSCVWYRFVVKTISGAAVSDGEMVPLENIVQVCFVLSFGDLLEFDRFKKIIFRIYWRMNGRVVHSTIPSMSMLVCFW